MKHLKPYHEHGIGPLFDSVLTKSGNMMESCTDYDPHDGRTLRDEGIKQISEHNEPWVDQCRRAVERWLIDVVTNGTFTGEDIRFWCRVDVGEPSHPNGWGALINSLVKRKLIVATGEYVQPKDKTSHARAIQVYRKV